MINNEEIYNYINHNISGDSVVVILKNVLKGNEEDYTTIDLVCGASGLDRTKVGHQALDGLAQQAMELGCVYVAESRTTNLSWDIDNGVLKPLKKYDTRRYGVGILKINEAQSWT